MRSILGLGLLIALSSSADAATVHHIRRHHHLILRSDLASSSAYLRGRTYTLPWPMPMGGYHDIPSYNDPSKFGGQPPN
jgi:hypothetical protein